jgi:hypothetical protein
MDSIEFPSKKNIVTDADVETVSVLEGQLRHKASLKRDRAERILDTLRSGDAPPFERDVRCQVDIVGGVRIERLVIDGHTCYRRLSGDCEDLLRLLGITGW